MNEVWRGTDLCTVEPRTSWDQAFVSTLGPGILSERLSSLWRLKCTSIRGR